MSMGPTLRCSDDLVALVPKLMEQRGITTWVSNAADGRTRMKFERWCGCVNARTFGQPCDGHRTLWLTCGSGLNPLLWLPEMALIGRVENILLEHGAVPVPPGYTEEQAQAIVEDMEQSVERRKGQSS